MKDKSERGGGGSQAGGFSLAECLIALSLSLFVVCASLEFFGIAQKHFFGLKEKEEAGQDALAALDKMRIDVLRAGQGLSGPMGLGLLETVTKTGDGLETVRAENAYILDGSVAAGSTRITLTRTTDIKPGREICISDGEKGELQTVTAVEGGAVVVSAPLAFGYDAGAASLALLERVRLSWDQSLRSLKRKVNASSAQPLLDDVRFVDFEYDEEQNIVRLRLSLDGQGENTYEIVIFPKNPALARTG